MAAPITTGDLRRRCAALAKSIDAQAFILSQLARRDLPPTQGVVAALDTMQRALDALKHTVGQLEGAPS